jgi:hypothetical protein
LAIVIHIPTYTRRYDIYFESLLMQVAEVHRFSPVIVPSRARGTRSSFNRYSVV